MSAAEYGAGAAGARAAATAVTATLGRSTALVRLRSPPLPGAPAEELGLPSPEFHDVALVNCVVRVRRDGSRQLLVSATILEAALGALDAEDARLSLSEAAFVQVGSAALLLREVQVLQVQGRAYLYRLLLREPSAEVRG